MVYKNYKSSENGNTIFFGSISASATSLTCKAGEGDLFPTVFPFLLTLEKYSGVFVIKREVVEVTNRVDDLFTIVRAVVPCVQDDTAEPKILSQNGLTFADGDSITNAITSENEKDFKAELELKAKTTDVVLKEGNQTINGEKTFTEPPIMDGSKITGISAEVKSTSLNYMLGGTGTVGKGYSLNPYEQLGVGTSNDFGSIAQPEVAQSFYAQNIDIATLKLMIKKTSSPSDNILLEIQTDNSGVPSGTVVTNGTSDNIAGTGLTTSFVETSFTFASVPVLTEATLYHIVVKRSGADDAVNYYGVESNGSSNQIGTASLNTGSWANATDDLYFKMQVGYELITLGGNNFVGILQIAGSIGEIRKVNKDFDDNQSGLVAGNHYGFNLTTGDIESGGGFYARSTTELDLNIVASETKEGIIKIATDVLVATGTDDNDAITSLKLDNYTKATAGTTILIDNNPETSGSGATYIKRKEISITRGGVYTVTFTGRTTGTFGFFRIYVNGIAVGIERTTDNVSVAWTEDISIEHGDLIQIYAKLSSGAYYINAVSIKYTPRSLDLIGVIIL